MGYLGTKELMKGISPVSNGTIDGNDKSVLKEIFALLLVLIGCTGVITGVGMVWGKGGVLILLSATIGYIGFRLGVSKTGKE